MWPLGWTVSNAGSASVIDRRRRYVRVSRLPLPRAVPTCRPILSGCRRCPRDCQPVARNRAAVARAAPVRPPAVRRRSDPASPGSAELPRATTAGSADISDVSWWWPAASQGGGHHVDSICHPLSPFDVPVIYGGRRIPHYALCGRSALAGLVGAGGSDLSGAGALTGTGGCSQPKKLGPATVEMCWI